MYKVNDTVVYASYGICLIKAIETRDFSGEPKEYFILQPVGDSRNTFYIPTDNEALKEKMRRICSREEVEELINVMPEENSIWIENEQQRKEIYRQIIEKGDRHELVKLIKTLYIYRSDLENQHKKLHSADERNLKDAENMLYDEFAYALGISRDEVLPYIKERIK